jgi:hypothetical protein
MIAKAYFAAPVTLAGIGLTLIFESECFVGHSSQPELPSTFVSVGNTLGS